ncbi:Glycosyltransferase involved in cell wall bisynthesis [Verrucomicrobium sp. GAS474]|uniref:glycosyltransferase family 4 protein n=1 Tax=Verrucomicrobium sp. GAS474 TaxID=1882831 RepID=UPI00087DD71D|nr:glycosyltransferase family 4 protein [Verrucomicrobium sp. GAS474]SDU23279.1 Glycosyltransferase involved in cell wall bisynthesis [Verrucomicrobium sp. GAS474]
MKVAYLFITFPVASQTFLQREIRGVAASGIEVHVHSMWTPSGVPAWEPVPGVTLHTHRPGELFSRPDLFLVEAVRQLAHLPAGLAHLLSRPPRSGDEFNHAFLGLLFALRHAAAFRLAGYDLIHGAWATAPATAAAILGAFCGFPFSFGAHAYDIHRRGGDRFLDAKLKRAALVHTTTQMNVDYLSGRVPEAREKIVLSRRGLTTLPPLDEIAARPPIPAAGPVRIVSVGRLVPKKGQASQIEAIALLRKAGIAATLRIVGDGPLQAELAARAEALGVADAVTLTGHLSEAAVREEYRRADLFCHSGIIDSEGDRDGLPNVIPEAMACGLPVVSSDAAGTTEAIHDGKTGLIAPGGKPEAIAAAVRKLAGNDALCATIRAEARAWVEENFLVSKNAAKLAEAFRRVTSSRP